MRKEWGATAHPVRDDQLLILSQDENKSLVNAGLRQITALKAAELLQTPEGQKPYAVYQYNLGLKGEDRTIWVCKERLAMAEDTRSVQELEEDFSRLYAGKPGWQSQHLRH